MNGEKINTTEKERWNMEGVGFRGEEEVSKEIEHNTAETRGESDDTASKVEEARAAVLESYKNEKNNIALEGSTLRDDTEETPVKNEQKKVLEIIKRIGSGALGGAVTTASLLSMPLIAVASAPVFAAACVPLFGLAVCGAGSVLHAINGVNGSMFEVNKKNEIHQTMNPIPYLIKYHGKNSDEVFRTEALKLFEGLEKNTKYKTKSHSVTFMALRRLEKEGKIKNLEKEESGTSRLFLENLGTGNFKAIFENKKRKMYQISFEVV